MRGHRAERHGKLGQLEAALPVVIALPKGAANPIVRQLSKVLLEDTANRGNGPPSYDVRIVRPRVRRLREGGRNLLQRQLRTSRQGSRL